MSRSNKLLILGANGLLGTHVIKAVQCYSNNLELVVQKKEHFVSINDTLNYLSAVNPAAVINCLGYFGSDIGQLCFANTCTSQE
jgi:dTDP-4-dehydrorhamnose reductase